MKKLKLSLKRLLSFVLTNERINSQTCVAKDIDTSKTILDHNKLLNNIFRSFFFIILFMFF